MSDHKRTMSATQTLEQYYNGSLGATKQTVSANPLNYYGFEIENNDAAAEVFVQFYNQAAANVTVGLTTPDWTYRIPAGANYGKDPQSFALKFCQNGLVVACTSTRTGAGAPASNCTITVWHWDKGN